MTSKRFSPGVEPTKNICTAAHSMSIPTQHFATVPPSFLGSLEAETCIAMKIISGPTAKAEYPKSPCIMSKNPRQPSPSPAGITAARVRRIPTAKSITDVMWRRRMLRFSASSRCRRISSSRFFLERPVLPALVPPDLEAVLLPAAPREVLFVLFSVFPAIPAYFLHMYFQPTKSEASVFPVICSQSPAATHATPSTAV